MAVQNDKNTITISMETIRKKGGVVILTLEEYKRLYESAVPTFYLEGEEAEELDRLVEEGLKDYKMGRTIRARSLKEALRIYGRKKNKKKGVLGFLDRFSLSH